jgi:hypothetical protein
MKGLDIFKAYFRDHTHRYALIGGAAALLEMEDFGEEFRVTRDLDIVLLVEARDPAFGTLLWEFAELGGYERREVGGKAQFYRFSKPKNMDFPVMLELFSRSPDGLVLAEHQRAIPISFGEELLSLSALLLDDDYYDLVIGASRAEEGLSWVSASGLIPLKAKAWLDLRSRKLLAPETVDSRHIGKHFNDVLALSQIVSPNAHVDVLPSVLTDLTQFIEEARAEKPSKEFGEALDTMLDRIASIYGLSPI